MLRILILLVFASTAALAALDVDLSSPNSIRAAAKAVATNLMSYYHGDEPGQIPGILPGPPPEGDYYWWQGGALWGTMVDYWHLTGDTTWANVTQDALVFQAGPPDYSYQPENWTLSLGNDDQGFWGLSAMLAAENRFPDPPSSKEEDRLGWLALAQGVFHTQAAPDRHDDTCSGGLRWQIPSTNKGYDYKNTIANGIFFNMGARLARYTGNDTYARWATETYEWLEGVGYVDAEHRVFDGAHTLTNCSDINKAQFSYTAAVLLQGAAFMYNYTNGAEEWQQRLQGLVNQTIFHFFPDDAAAVELACEQPTTITCTTDMKSFKGYLHRWLASAAQVAPIVRAPLQAALQRSTAAAVTACVDGEDNGHGVTTATCGFRWTTGGYDGDTGAGQQMNVLGALLTRLVDIDPQTADARGGAAPVTNSTGGTSVGSSHAGSDPDAAAAPERALVTSRDRAVAGAVTGMICVSTAVVMLWMSTHWWEKTGVLAPGPPSGSV